MKTRLIALLTAVALLALPTQAQERQPMQINSYGAVLDNIDLLIDHYANFLARKYELTDEQDQYTRHMLRERSHEFLDTHEDQLRGLIETLFEVRTGGDMSPDGLLDWGEAARPIYEDARKLIVAGNNDWRDILNEDQKLKHDEDLKLMYESFETTEEQLDRITAGEMTVDEFRNPRRSRTVRRSTARATNDTPPPPPDYSDPPSNRLDPPSDEATSAARERAQALRERLAERRRMRAEERATMEDKMTEKQVNEARVPTTPSKPSTPPPGRRVTPAREEEPERETTRKTPTRTERVTRSDTETPEKSSRKTPTRRSSSSKKSGKDHASTWEKYVEDFIKRYDLDDAQQQQARSILEDCKKKADQYLTSKKSKMESIDAELTRLRAVKKKSKRQTAQVTALTEQQQSMREPIDEIFEKQLKPRLDKIPRRSQLRAAESSKNKKKSGK